MFSKMRVTTFAFSILVAFGITVLPSAVLSKVQDDNLQESAWTGTLDARGKELRLEISIKPKGKTLTGKLKSLDQKNVTMKLAEITADGKAFSFSVPKISATFKGTYSANGSIVDGTFTQSGIRLPLMLEKADLQKIKKEAEEKAKEKLKEAWVGKMQIGMEQPIMQFRIVTLEDGETKAYFDSITEGFTGFKAAWSNEDGKLDFDVARIGLTYRGKLNEAGDTAEGIWTQAGRDFPLTLKKQDTQYDDFNVWENRPQRPQGPLPYDVEEVTIENKDDELLLAGSLTIPKGEGRYPVVILISGSGPQDRDETLMGHKPFLVLADYLTRQGIAVLRYDDRGTAESTGKFKNSTTEDFARDTSAVVDFLKEHDRIDPTQIGLAGHSEGGLVAPMVIGLRDDIAFVVLLAATGVDGAAISESQTETMLRASGADEEEIEFTKSLNRKAIGLALTSKPDQDLSEEINKVLDELLTTLSDSKREEMEKTVRLTIKSQSKQLTRKWTHFFLSYDPRPALANIKCPVLAITGTKDTQVVPELNVPEIRKALATGGNKDVTIIQLEGLNHLFQECETGLMNEYITIQETFNPGALEKIGDWIKTQTRSPKK